MGESTRSADARQAKPKKPHKDFPLFAHASGRWAKKVKGQFAYFGKVVDDPKGEAALDLWREQKDDLLAGRKPRRPGDFLCVADLCSRFREVKDHQQEIGEISPRTNLDYASTCDRIVAVLGKNRAVENLGPTDFELLRRDISKTRGLISLGNEIQRMRTVFRFAYESNWIEKPIRFGPTFKRPSKKSLLIARASKGSRMLEAPEILEMLGKAVNPLKAMILLGANCGFGNSDCGNLPMKAVDLEGGWINFPRPKTGIKRRCPLWKETVTALREAIADQPEAKQDGDKDLVFVTKYGMSWAKETGDNPISKETRKLLDELKLHRPGLGFYSLRHTFETIGGESLDQVAVNHIMGHSDASMAAHYRERISDGRLKAVTDHVHAWLFGAKGGAK